MFDWDALENPGQTPASRCRVPDRGEAARVIADQPIKSLVQSEEILVPLQGAEGRRLVEAMGPRGHDAFTSWSWAWEPQHHGAFCAPASMVAALRFLKLGCELTQTQIYERILKPRRLFTTGVSLDHGAEMARILGQGQLQVQVRCSRGEDELALWLRADLAAAFETGEQICLLANYWRVNGGGGHWSPLGGWSEGYVLIFDTNDTKSPPHWVRIANLVKAFCRHNEATGKPRGYLVLKRI